jgi:hypothetical protein
MTGAADGLIIPIIITDHMTHVMKRSVALNGALAGMPIDAMVVIASVGEAICRLRWTR